PGERHGPGAGNSHRAAHPDGRGGRGPGGRNAQCFQGSGENGCALSSGAWQSRPGKSDWGVSIRLRGLRNGFGRVGPALAGTATTQSKLADTLMGWQGRVMGGQFPGHPAGLAGSELATWPLFFRDWQSHSLVPRVSQGPTCELCRTDIANFAN